MDIFNFDKYEHHRVEYGGRSSRKEILVLDDNSRWMIKFHGRNSHIKRQRKNENLPDYTNSVICEWLGSHIYQKLGFQTQNTILGYLNNQLVVACQHIYEKGEILYELRGMIKSLNDDFFEFFSSGGTISDIQSLSRLLNSAQIFSEINLNEYFWDIFVADAFINNTDRNLGNIGLIFSLDNKFRKSPIYDNGNSFNSRLTEEGMKNILRNWNNQSKSVFLNSRCPYKIEDTPIDPLTYIYKNPCADCIDAIGRIVPRINLSECIKPVLELKDSGVISKTQSAFYVMTMSMRYRKRLLPAYEQHFGPLQKDEDLQAMTPRF